VSVEQNGKKNYFYFHIEIVNLINFKSSKSPSPSPINSNRSRSSRFFSNYDNCNSPISIHEGNS
jgi:hypothetical protein